MSSVRIIYENLIDDIGAEIAKSTSIYMISSFVMQSGIFLLEPYLKSAVERGVDIKILTGDYLFITQPEALKRLVEIDHRLEVRLWKSNGKSFHPKAYLFQYQNGDGTLIIGSSNLSNSALTSGVEWNLLMDRTVEPQTFEEAIELFMRMFYHENTISLNKETVSLYEKDYNQYHTSHRALAKKWAELEDAGRYTNGQTVDIHKTEDQIKEANRIYETIRPNPAQQQALIELELTLEEGYDRAMVVMATGLGKTYLAGFFAQRFQKVLFVAHREEILRQAKRSFERLMPDRSSGLYMGFEKAENADNLFASNFTLANRTNLERFAPEQFDLIIIDEFHHAAAQTYQAILDYFRPAFLLGITATPDRMDGQDVYSICDGNVAYKITFVEAIEAGWLAPFRYFGIYDDIDYSNITWLGRKYDEEELLAVQLQEDVAEKIYHAWIKHKQSRTLAFCSSIMQSNFLSQYFQERGVQTVSLHSRSIDMTRNEAIRRLESGNLDIIFTVDLFNEGVDIPAVDTLLFARPTESLTVFIQQIGRGLRKHAGKQYCHIIDLIGNYRNADVKLGVFSVTESESLTRNQLFPKIPECCELNLDTRVIDLLRELGRKRQPRKEKLKESYLEAKQNLGRRPTYLELHLYGSAECKEYRQEFKSYIGFLEWAGELQEKEVEAYRTYKEWLEEVEKTGMSKSYKMVVLQYMLSRGEENWYKPVTAEEVAPFFHHYLTEKEYRKKIDFSDKQGKDLWQYNQQKVAKLITDMPMTKWSGSSRGLVSFSEGIFRFNLEIAQDLNSQLFQWTKWICEYRLHYHFERKGNRNRINP